MDIMVDRTQETKQEMQWAEDLIGQITRRVKWNRCILWLLFIVIFLGVVGIIAYKIEK